MWIKERGVVIGHADIDWQGCRSLELTMSATEDDDSDTSSVVEMSQARNHLAHTASHACCWPSSDDSTPQGKSINTSIRHLSSLEGKGR